MSPRGCQKMSAKPCNQNAEENFPVLSLKRREQKPPNPLLMQDKDFYRLPLGCRIEFLVQTCDKVVGLLRERKFGIGQVALLRPTCRVVDQVRKGHMTSALREIDVAGAEAIADGYSQPQFPGATLQRRVRLVQRCPKSSWDKSRRGM